MAILVGLLAVVPMAAAEWITLPGPEGPVAGRIHPDIVFLDGAPDKSTGNELEPLDPELPGFYRLATDNKAARAKMLQTLGQRFPNRAPVLALGKRGELGWAVLDREIVVELETGKSVGDLASLFLSKFRPLSFLENTYLVRPFSADPWAGVEWARELSRRDGVRRSWVSLKRPRTQRSIPNDPLFSEQWHLRNNGQSGGAADNDINVLSAWESYKGSGIRLAIVDNGVEYSHPDLMHSVDLNLSYDYFDDDPDPAPADGFESHGTAIAGLIGATQNNVLGVSGVAPRATMGALRAIFPGSTDSIEALALGHHIDPLDDNFIHVSANPWGPSDAGTKLSWIGPLAQAALEAGITDGRNGKGIVYIWAAGNGRRNLDNVNYDAYASSRYTIAVGASGPDGLVSGYSEPGAALLVNAPSSKDGIGITTTDQTGTAGYDPGNYIPLFGGTSAASAIAAGVAALVLEANPDLHWRDVQHVFVESAFQNEPDSSGWQLNGGGYAFHQDYGFGRVDALAATTLAADFDSVPESASAVTFTETAVQAIPDNNSNGIVLTAPISTPNGYFLEHAELTVEIEHGRRGDLEIVLVSPDGTEATLAQFHADDNPDYPDWTFMSVATWGESGDGLWTLRIRDLQGGNLGTLTEWQLTLHGFVDGSSEGEGSLPLSFHSADTDADHSISLSELLRVVQLYNAGSFGCSNATDDGYAPGAMPQDCAPHDSDYRPIDWSIRLTEILRLIQLYNLAEYFPCEEGEDGFCSGNPHLS